MNSGNKKIAIIVPVYKPTLTVLEQFSVDYLLKNAKERDIFFVAPQHLDRRYYQERFPTISWKLFADSFFESISGYNHLMLDPGFYTTFIDYDYILIHHTDALIFKDNLSYWMDQGHDYIGSPWPDGVEINLSLSKFHGVNLKTYVGNGGFSIRSVQGALNLFEEVSEIREHWLKCNSHEDLFFAFGGLISNRFKVPNLVVAARFALESDPEKYFRITDEEVPTGCHAWWRCHFRFWQMIVTQMG